MFLLSHSLRKILFALRQKYFLEFFKISTFLKFKLIYFEQKYISKSTELKITFNTFKVTKYRKLKKSEIYYINKNKTIIKE
jgi:hypothetical protein